MPLKIFSVSKVFKTVRLLCVGALSLSATAHAGVFDLASHVDIGNWSAGLEPEVLLGSDTGAGINLKPRYGISDILNIGGIVGVGSSAKAFRVGVIADLDWFPDYKSQPGIATPLFVEFSRQNSVGFTQIGVKPMLYKGFDGTMAHFTPFIAIPIGWNFFASRVQAFSQIALGSMLHIPSQKNVAFTAEAGFNISNTNSYISGGFTYFH